MIDLMSAYPGRQWRMIELVRHVARGRPNCKQQRDRYRKGIIRVLQALSDAEAIRCRPGRRGQPTMYIWRSGTG